MAYSNLVAFFIILTAGATLHSQSASGIQTSTDAAKALEPLAGKLAFLLFASGVIGTGLLAVPVLAGSAAYAVSETFRWRASLEMRPRQAPKFYAILSGATLIGVLLNFFAIDPIRALYWSAVLNGITSVPLMIMLMLLSGNKAVTGQFPVPVYLRVTGWAATLVMTVASLTFLWSTFLGPH
jgi:Mn2+/Fe2+ NRAMP family transporter